MSQLHYVFVQFGLHRDRLHEWFGACIALSGSCRDVKREAAIQSLAAHIVTEMTPAAGFRSHTDMFQDFQQRIHIPRSQIDNATMSAATSLMFNAQQ